nr:hypothetical protein [Tanacetum cinerariifolium]
MKRKIGNEDRDVRQTQNSKYSESLETPPIKRKVGRPKKSVRANENKSSSVKRRGRPRKSNDEEKKQTIGSKGLSRLLDCVKLNELNKKFQVDFCNKDLARNEDAEDANVANPSEATNVAQASPTAQGSCAAILHASPIKMTKKDAKRTC